MLIFSPVSIRPEDSTGPDNDSIVDSGSGSTEDDAETGKDEKKEEIKRLGVVPLPIAYYTPESSFGFGAGIMFTFRGKGDTLDDRPDSLMFMGVYTLKNQYAVNLVPDFYFDRENWELKVESNYSRMPSSFFGNGNDSKPDSEEDYTLAQAMVKPWIIRKVYRRFRVGLVFDFKWADLVESEKDGLLDQRRLGGETGGIQSGFGPVLDWDSRDNLFFPARGGLYRFNAIFYRSPLGSDFDYEAYALDLRKYVALDKRQKHVLALQGLGLAVVGEVPFFERARIDFIRGIYAERFLDRILCGTQVEYRFPIYWRFLGAVFAAAGDVGDKMEDFRIEDFKYGGGAGLHFVVNKQEKVTIRLDVGFSPWGIFPYFQFQEAF